MTPRPLNLLRLPEEAPFRALGKRILLAVGLILLVTVALWFDRDGLKDNIHPDRAIRFVDVFYFTVVSLTTVGYGDIVPQTGWARFVNATFLTPVRLVVWAIFLGTAYELVLLRTRESFKMSQLQSRLKNHAIICGFGETGRAIFAELRAHDFPLDQIVVIEQNEGAAQIATGAGAAVFCGDASSEAVLQSAKVEGAAHVLVAPGADDRCVLICLTVRALNSQVRLVASANEDENIKLLYRAGADVVVSPAVSGGRLMGAAVHQSAVSDFLQDILSYGSGLEACEWTVGSGDTGQTPEQIGERFNAVVLGVSRGGKRLAWKHSRGMKLEIGDVVVLIEEGKA